MTRREFVRGTVAACATGILGTRSASAALYRVVATLNLRGLYDVTLNPVRNVAYVSAGDRVHVLDLISGTIGATIDTPAAAVHVAVNPSTGLVYVGHYGTGDPLVSVIDGALGSISGKIPLANVNHGADVQAIGVSSATNRIYVVARVDATHVLYMIDGHDHALLAATKLDFATSDIGLTVSPKFNRVYLISDEGRDLVVVDGASNQVTHKVFVGSYPEGMALNPLAHRLYVALDRDFGDMTVFDEDRIDVVDTYKDIGWYVYAIGVDTTRKRILWGHGGTARDSKPELSIVDETNGRVIERMDIWPNISPQGLQVHPVTGHVCMWGLFEDQDDYMGIISILAP